MAKKKNLGRASGSGVLRRSRGRPSLLKDFEPTALAAEIKLIEDPALLSRLREAAGKLSSWLGDGREIPKPLALELVRFLDLLRRRKDDVTLVELVLEARRTGAPLAKGSPDGAYAVAAERLGETDDSVEKRFRQLHPDLVAATGSHIRPQLPKFRRRKSVVEQSSLHEAARELSAWLDAGREIPKPLRVGLLRGK